METETETDMETDISQSVVHKFKKIPLILENLTLEKLKKRCSKLGYPTTDEYSFTVDNTLEPLGAILRDTTDLRVYQSLCLSKLFRNSCSRSGVIVLPCGSGKTLVGVAAACTIGKPCIILCTSVVAVDQWYREILKWSYLSGDYILQYSGAQLTNKVVNDKKKLNEVKVVISTYRMFSYSGNRSTNSKIVMDMIKSRVWGLLILDEVHVAPAKTFRKTIDSVKTHTKIGLTATLLREDKKIPDLTYLIGPKLYEANWLDLQQEGFIASVKCAEVRCKLTPIFFKKYQELQSENKKRLLCFVNPTKFQLCQFLINYHEKKGDKIMIFSDNLFALRFYANNLNIPSISGATSGKNRIEILNTFRYSEEHNALLISKVGDNSIDLPEANVIIQISGQFASQRQEAQRLGRVLRPKKSKSSDEADSFFYTLVSEDTKEMLYSKKRRTFLINQGFEFKTVNGDISKKWQKNLLFTHEKEQKLMLTKILEQNENSGKDEQVPDIVYGSFPEEIDRIVSTSIPTSLSSLSGGVGRTYIDRPQNN
eukprot:Anaeramoba_flamelloidesa573845_40.p1 GENE.a573845_40~~a573845_40.p1  ORF type:complete len:538 (+),score=99.47 a573845_40:2-1615(+)